MSSRGRGRGRDRDASPSRQSSIHNNSSNNDKYRNRSPERKDIEKKHCEYGNNCYRKNPQHFDYVYHPIDEIVYNYNNNADFLTYLDGQFKNDKNIKDFIIYIINHFELIIKNYDIQLLKNIFTQFDGRTISRTIPVCDEKQIKIIQGKLNGNNIYTDIYNSLNAPGVNKELQKKTYKIKCENFILINSSFVLWLLTDYQEKQKQQDQEHKTPGGKRESYKRKSYKRKTYKKKNNKNKKNRSVKNRRI
jgi:hypothetical protein